MTQESFPCGIYELEGKDEITVFVNNSHKVVRAGDFRDRRGRSPMYMVELVDVDRFFFVTEQAARDFMMMHALSEVTEEQLNEIRNQEDTDAE